MYSKRLSLLVPLVGRAVGFDLEKGDWVAPYGSGATCDLEFTVEGRYESRQNYAGELTLRVPGASNGIRAHSMDLNSRLKMPYEAPESGYVERVVWRNRRETMPGSQSIFFNEPAAQEGYFLRIRSITDQQGRMIQANYGKIHGPVYFQTFEGGRSRIGFTYYYNPEPTRNLEFEPSQNLFSDLNADELVVDP